ncbi:LRR receptor-like serine/threonine-protein kinase GSO1 [Coffea eugenioides]|uniref:LRR receptor-like serine/threonine-protein kinase GSO1 n=1 Tax=Coffea eugenioides TaxID=49369 RepID=UPI000F6152CC|nr:LRR receptor-like serine/threonine-protein kinase GSO1 [Coffea eugenioides]
MTGCTAMKRLSLGTDQSALLALKAHITSERQEFLSKNWSSAAAASSVCDWIGVQCSSRRQRVTALNISNMGLTGTIPPDLGNLSFLVSLDLRNNSFHGNLPEELSHLRRLRFVRLTSNNFTGEIPMWFGHFPELQFLFLDSNGFSGFIPSSISNSSKVEALTLRGNFLEGNIPEKMGNLSVLKDLSLSGNYLVGQIPLSLCKFSQLQSLDLSSNRLSGHIPKEIGNLEKLTYLSLMTNNFTGAIPREIGKLRGLKVLMLGRNNLTGTIPQEIGNLQNLQGLNLEWNQITGSIPKEIGNLTMLTELYFANNSLIGTMPREMGSLCQLENLQLPYNGLNGSIPPGIFNLSALRNIHLASNLLSGNLPRDLGYRLPKLLFIELAGNNLGGVIPVSITNCSQLIILELSINGFTGSIPDALGDLRLLQYLDLYGNNLTSDPTSMELSFITSLTKCKNLVYLELGPNPLNGLLPASIGNLSATLQELSIGSSGIKGTIPSQTGNLTNLILIDLQSNHLIGGIPTAFKNLQNLQGLTVGDNNLNDTLDKLCNLHSLTSVDLTTNQFSGSIPECFGNMTSLRDLELGNNFLAYAIPNSFWNLKDLLQLNLSSNSLNGSLPLEVGTLKAVTSIDISANQFSGDIPSTTGGLQNLLILNFSQNQFHGSIPESFGNMLSLQGLYLSHNNLSGFIPKSLEALRFHVPSCPRTNSIQRSRTKKVLLFAFAPLGLASVVVAALAIVFRRYWKKYQDSKGTNMVLVPMQERVSHYELLRATDGYSEINLLGIGSFGSVYKGILNDGRSIAVKVFNLELEGVLKSFDAESEVLKNLRHRNLLKVISGCWNQDFRALVLAYMCNGSLEKWLYSDNYFLDTLQRLNILIDVASAVQYLHEEYSTPVIHCDLKPSNVLLDEDMVAHVSDFGIAKMLEKEESFAWTKTLATIGYIAPEYGSEGLISAKCDVYSYGIMLMEVFSRRKPNDEMFAGNLNLKSWINNSLPNSILRVIDAKLLQREDENFTEKLEVLSSILELALKCVCESPRERVSMKVTLETLKKIKLKFLRVMEVDS